MNLIMSETTDSMHLLTCNLGTFNVTILLNHSHYITGSAPVLVLGHCNRFRSHLLQHTHHHLYL